MAAACCISQGADGAAIPLAPEPPNRRADRPSSSHERREPHLAGVGQSTRYLFTSQRHVPTRGAGREVCAPAGPSWGGLVLGRPGPSLSVGELQVAGSLLEARLSWDPPLPRARYRYRQGRPVSRLLVQVEGSARCPESGWWSEDGPPRCVLSLFFPEPPRANFRYRSLLGITLPSHARQYHRRPSHRRPWHNCSAQSLHNPCHRAPNLARQGSVLCVDLVRKPAAWFPGPHAFGTRTPTLLWAAHDGGSFPSVTASQRMNLVLF